jgi:hypothetical protein
VSNNLIARNYIYSIGATTSHRGIAVANGSNNQVIYNVIAVGTGDGIEVGVDGLNTSIYNNTVYGNAGPGLDILATNDGGNIARNNIFYANSTPIVDARGDLLASHNLSTNPSFVDAAAGDFTLQESSAARDAGMLISGLTVDFLGNPVPQGATTDIGAFESSFPSRAGGNRLQRGNVYAGRLVGRRNVY